MAVAAALRAVAMLGPVHDYDEGVYWESLRALDHGARLFAGVYSSQPPLFLGGVRPAFDLLGGGLLGGRAVVVALSLAGVAAGGVLAARLAGPAAGAGAALLLAVDPMLLRAGSSLMSDAPAMALALLAGLAAAVAAGWGEATPVTRPRWAAAAGALLAAAVLVKLLAASAAPGVVALLAAAPGSARPARVRALAAAAAGAVGLAVLVVAPLATDLGAAAAQVVGLHLSSQAVDEGGWAAASPDLVRELPVALLGAGGLAALRHNPAAVVLVAWLAGGLAALVAVRPLWPHHLVAAAVPLALAGGAGGDALLRRRGGAAVLAPVAAAAAVVAAITVSGLALDGGQSASDATVARLAAAMPAGSVVVTDDPAAAARAGLDTPAWTVDTSLVRILSGDLTTADVEAAASSPGVAGVYLGTGRLEHLDGLVAWLRRRFPDSVALGEGTLLLRLPPTA